MGMVMGMIMDPFSAASFYSTIVEVERQQQNAPICFSRIWWMCNYEYEYGWGRGCGLGMRHQVYFPYILWCCSLSSICIVVEGEAQHQNTPTCLSHIWVDGECLYPWSAF